MRSFVTMVSAGVDSLREVDRTVGTDRTVKTGETDETDEVIQTATTRERTFAPVTVSDDAGKFGELLNGTRFLGLGRPVERLANIEQDSIMSWSRM